MKTIAALIVEGLLISGLVMVSALVESIPYNVRELFSTQNIVVSGLLFFVIFNLTFSFPVILAYGLSRCRKWQTAVLFSPAVWACGGLIFSLLIFTVSMESIHDVVGSPVLGWPWKWEQAYRFVFLTAPFICLWAGGAGLVRAIHLPSPAEKRGIIYWMLNASILLPLSYIVVVEFAATDNLVELLGGGVLSCLWIGLWIMLIGVVSSFVCAQSVFKRSSIGAGILLALLSLPLGYYLLDFALVRDLNKYGSHFSGLQFLLSTDRSSYATGTDLILRYVLLHMGISLIMGICQLPFWELWKGRKAA